MTVPYSFGTATSAIPLSQLDSNFNTPITLGNTAIQLGNTVTTLNNMTLANVTISSGNVTITNVTVTTANATTVNATTVNTTDLAASGNVTLSGGTANGVAYLNGSKVLTTGSGLVFDGSNLGIGTSSPGSYNAAARNLVLAGSSSYVGMTLKTSGGVANIVFSNAEDTGVDGLIQYDTTSNYLRFDTNGSERMRLDASGNLGLGVTPSAWASNYRVLQMRESYAALASDNGNGVAELTSNAYNDGSWRYANSSVGAVRYQANAVNRTHAWYTAPSGTAGNAISFTQAMTLDASGNLVLGNTSAYARLTSYVASSGTFQNAFGASNGADSDLQIRIKTGVSDFQNSAGVITFTTGTTERARIDSSGNFLVAKTVINNTVVGNELRANGELYSTLAGSTNTDTTLHAFSNGANAYRFYVGLGGTVYATSTTISAISDQRLKENVQDLDVGLDAVMALKPRKFDWKAGKGKDIKGDRGFIAQEFEQVFPDLIDEWKDPAPEGEEPYKSVRQDLIPVLVKAIQELKAEVDSLKAQLKGN